MISKQANIFLSIHPRCCTQWMLLWLLLGNFACRPEPEVVNFLMNSRDLKISENRPEDAMDEATVLRLYQGDTVVFRDISHPISKVENRLWSLDGDATHEKETGEIIKWAYDSIGWYKVGLCINGNKACVMKWIFVEEAFELPPLPSPPPSPIPPPPRPVNTAGSISGIKPPAPVPSPPPPPLPTLPPIPQKAIGYVSAADFNEWLTQKPCAAFSTSSFTIVMTPKEDGELRSMDLMSDNCGKVLIVIKGGGIEERMTKSLTRSKSSIKFEPINLSKGTKYTMSVEGMSGGNCPDPAPPRFMSSGTCKNPDWKEHRQLVISQEASTKPILFDINFKTIK